MAQQRLREELIPRRLREELIPNHRARARPIPTPQPTRPTAGAGPAAWADAARPPAPPPRRRADATLRDLILAIRADEANHRDVNHAFAGLKPDATNPFLGKH